MEIKIFSEDFSLIGKDGEVVLLKRSEKRIVVSVECFIYVVNRRNGAKMHYKF